MPPKTLKPKKTDLSDPFGIESLRKQREERDRQEAQEKAERRRALRSRAILMFVSLTVLVGGIVHFAAWGLYGHFVVEPEFKKEVHGHTLNAYYANTPDLMIRELEAAKAGMRDFGLDGHEYSTLKPWEQTPDNRMDYQYQLIDSVIERIEAVENDRRRQEQQGTSDQLGDVYETKMDNLRSFLFEDGWIDETAKGSYQIEQHPYWAWWNNWGFYTIPVFILVIGGIVPYGIAKWKEDSDDSDYDGIGVLGTNVSISTLIGLILGALVFLVVALSILSSFASSVPTTP